MRKIIHVDMDCFFAAVEVRENPALKGLPVAVGGRPSGRGVISTCSYEARKFGVRSAMSSALGLKLCPQLILLRHSSAKYVEASRIVRKVFARYASKVEPLSLDEAYLDVTDSPFLERGSATLLAERIRADIFAETKLTASAGIAPNKLLAKLASEANKPNGQFTVSPKNILSFLENLPLRKIHGVGHVTAHRLAQNGLHKCSDVWKVPLPELILRYGKLGAMLYESCRGIDERPVEVGGERKCMSVERTFNRDLSETIDMQVAISELVDELKDDLKRHSHRQVLGLTVKIKYHDFKLTTIAQKGADTTFETAWNLYLERWKLDPRPVRLLGVGVRFASNEVTPTPQLSFDSILSAG